jgi:hypothetical protein
MLIFPYAPRCVEEGVELIMTRLREGMSYAQYMQLYTWASCLFETVCQADGVSLTEPSTTIARRAA